MATLTPVLVTGNNDYLGKVANPASLSTGDVVALAGNGILLHVRNTSTTITPVVGVTSALDSFGRTKDAAVTLGLGGSTTDSAILGPYVKSGWASTAGQLRITSTAAALVKITAIQL